MKKTLLLLATALLTGFTVADAQSRKTWDFSKGWSDETKQDLNADANWTSNRTDAETGETTGWKDGSKMYGYLTANGNVIKELDGIYFENSGLSGSGNYLIDPTSIRISRKNMAFSLPKLVKGQQVTVVAKSANATATDRGFTGNGNMTYISGPEGGICLGGEGYQTLVWEVTAESSDSVDIKISTAVGGLDIQLIQIDNGDEPLIVEDPNVAYVYTGDVDADNFRQYAGLDDYATVSNISIGELLDGTVSTDSIESFDVVVLTEGAQAVENAADYLQARLNRVPVLNLYPSSALGYEAVKAETASFAVAEDYLDAELFKELEFAGENDNELVVFGGETGVLGYTVAETSDFASDDVYALAGEANAIHLHGKKNTYILLPIQTDLVIANEDLNLTEVGTALISNVVKYLAATKADVLTAGVPTVKYVYENGKTTITLGSGISGAKIYYTLDGSEPTKASTRYTEPLVFTEPATLKAFVVAPAYNNSAVLEEQVIIKTQLAAPAFAVEYNEGSSVLTMTTSNQEAAIYYSFTGLSDAAHCAVYSEAITLTEPTNVYAFSVLDGYLNSQMVEGYVTVAGIPAVKDTVAHFTANQTDWYDNAVLHVGEESALVPEAVADGLFGATGQASAIYYFGKSTWSYYDYSKDETQVVLDEGGNPLKSVVDTEADSVIVIHYADEAALKTITSNTDPQWVMKSRGQVITGETTLSPENGISNGVAGRYANDILQSVGGLPTKGFIDFGGKGSGEPYSQSIESTSAFAAGEYDIVVYLGNGSTGDPILALQTSADGETWTTIVNTLNYTNSQRFYCKTRKHVSFTEPQYVRVTQAAGSSKGYIYDIYVITTEGTTGIQAVENNDVKVADDRIFDLQGRRVSVMVPGNIYLKNGKKVIVR
ncbi:MAG: chitobiase/beta-hexosaminidase C-terminal domain-containing protein [Bacteroidales bacterium]|nr:chitobiase/beta-hexosaminidase C-terminal domain-containing protein [Bacteroidales bacterium]